MPHKIMTTDVGDLNSAAMPNDTAVQAGGAGTAGTVKAAGDLWMQSPAGGLTPSGAGGGIGADIIVALATIPANAFDVANRTLEMWAAGSFAGNGNTKTVKMIINPTAPVIGSAVSGGTVLASTGAVTTNNQGWSMESQITKTGALGSNTQNTVHFATQVGSASAALANPQALTLNEAGAITVAMTINCATLATDAALWAFQGFWAN